MSKIININQVAALSQNLHKAGKKIVLAGGCFDVLHPGHVIFLEQAKKAGDTLVVILESDKNVRRKKGQTRPIHTQNMRARVLAALEAVDYVVLLPFMSSAEAYDSLLEEIKPDIVALTKSYSAYTDHKRAARFVGAKLKFVTALVEKHSTSRILEENEN